MSENVKNNDNKSFECEYEVLKKKTIEGLVQNCSPFPFCRAF